MRTLNFVSRVRTAMDVDTMQKIVKGTIDGLAIH